MASATNPWQNQRTREAHLSKKRTRKTSQRGRKRPVGARGRKGAREQPGSAQTSPIIAVVNSNDDLVTALRGVLLDQGYNVVPAHIRDIKSGRHDFAAFLTEHNPAVVIYDLAVPYEENWTFFQMLRKLPECRNRRFVLTTVNKRVLTERVGEIGAIEIRGGHAQDFEAIAQAVRDHVKSPRKIDDKPERG